jgi:hypothetical protein
MMSKPIVKVSYYDFGVYCGLLPTFISIALCLFFSYLWHFEAVTFTHCRVYNWVPSVSSVIGNHSPQKYIWRFGVVVVGLQRFCDGYLHYRQFQVYGARSGLKHTLNVITALLQTVQAFALAMLTVVASTEIHWLHVIAFVGWQLCSSFHMIFYILLFRQTSAGAWNDVKTYNYRGKLLIFSFNTMCICVATYFFIRHNSWCEPGSMFAALRLLTLWQCTAGSACASGW